MLSRSNKERTPNDDADNANDVNASADYFLSPQSVFSFIFFSSASSHFFLVHSTTTTTSEERERALQKGKRQSEEHVDVVPYSRLTPSNRGSHKQRDFIPLA